MLVAWVAHYMQRWYSVTEEYPKFKENAKTHVKIREKLCKKSLTFPDFNAKMDQPH